MNIQEGRICDCNTSNSRIEISALQEFNDSNKVLPTSKKPGCKSGCLISIILITFLVIWLPNSLEPTIISSKSIFFSKEVRYNNTYQQNVDTVKNKVQSKLSLNVRDLQNITIYDEGLENDLFGFDEETPVWSRYGGLQVNLTYIKDWGAFSDTKTTFKLLCIGIFEIAFDLFQYPEIGCVNIMVNHPYIYSNGESNYENTVGIVFEKQDFLNIDYHSFYSLINEDLDYLFRKASYYDIHPVILRELY